MKTHPCPAPGCPVTAVPNSMFSCSVDWFRLPIELRSQIGKTWCQGDVIGHARAMGTAARWFRDNPRQGVQK